VVGYNKRKHEILELVKIGYETSSEIAEACGISQTCASTLLKRYWDWGLLNRYTGHARATVYERMDEEEISYFLSNIKRCRVNKHLKRDAI
jgi:hypothetical protein